MNKIIKKFYIGIILLLIATIAIVYFQFQKTENIFYEEAEKASKVQSESLKLKIDYWVSENISVIEKSADCTIKNLKNPNFIEEDFREKLRFNPNFTSIYYGSTDNFMINGSGWLPPKDFDFRTRPWYLSAVETDKIVITDPFLNATGESHIITIAKTVRDKDNKILGVIAGDIKIDVLYDILYSYNNIEGAKIFLLDSNNKMITSNYGEDRDLGYENFKQLNFDRNKGFYINLNVNNSKWSVVGFIPVENYNAPLKKLAQNTYTSLGIFMFLFIFMLFYQNKNLILPMMNITHSIDNIDIKESLEYRIDETGNHGFKVLVGKINNLLDEVEEYSRQINHDKDEIHSLNEEMEATIEQLVATEQEAIAQKMNFESLFKYSLDGIVFFDNKHNVIDINKEFKRLFEYDIDEIRGMELDSLISGNNSEKKKETKELTHSLFAGNDIDFESIRYGKNNKPIYVQIKGVPIISDGYVIGGFGIYSDISKRKEREQLLTYMGEHDHLTGAYNRKYFEEYLKNIDSENQLPISIVLADINGLKLINDAFGSEIGDEFLKKTYFMFKDSIYNDYVIARLSGDEFAIILENADEKMVENFVEIIINNVKNMKVGDIDLSVTFGWATKLKEDIDISSIIKEAEDHLYKSKLIESPNARGNAINTIIDTLHEKNKREEQHSKRVSYLSYKFGKSLGLSERELKVLKTMGLLHDVGKIGIDEAILNKDSILTDKEFGEIKKHPEIGYRILSSVNELSEIADYVLAHHERWDGKGYPKGIAGSDIPYLSRIIAIADSYDAMTSDRAYRDAKSKEFAMKEIIDNCGTQFDPDLAKKFVEKLKSGYFE